MITQLYLWLRVSNLSHLALLEQLDAYGILTFSDLADILHVKNSAITKLVRSARKRGLVEEKQDNKDRRVKTLAITPVGKSHLMFMQSNLETIIGTRSRPE